MTHGLYGIAASKSRGKGGSLSRCIMHSGDILTGYMSPKLHRELRRTERSRKRRLL